MEQQPETTEEVVAAAPLDDNTTTPENEQPEKEQKSPKKKKKPQTEMTEEEIAERDRRRAAKRAAKKKNGGKEKKSKTSKKQREREKLLALQEATAGAAQDTIVSRGKALIELQKAKVRLSIKKAKAAMKKQIPIETRIQGPVRRKLRPYDNYFVNQIEPVLNDLCWACYKGKLDRVCELVEIEGYDVNDESNNDPWGYKQSPLHWAAKAGHVDVMEYLISKGAIVRSIDASGSYPLHLACNAGHLKAAILLVEKSDLMDLFVRDYDADMTPLEWTAISENKRIQQDLIKAMDKMWIKPFVSDLFDEKISDVVEGKNLLRLVIPKRRKKTAVVFDSSPMTAQPEEKKEVFAKEVAKEEVANDGVAEKISVEKIEEVSERAVRGKR